MSFWRGKVWVGLSEASEAWHLWNRSNSETKNVCQQQQDRCQSSSLAQGGLIWRLNHTGDHHYTWLLKPLSGGTINIRLQHRFPPPTTENPFFKQSKRCKSTLLLYRRVVSSLAPTGTTGHRFLLACYIWSELTLFYKNDSFIKTLPPPVF